MSSEDLTVPSLMYQVGRHKQELELRAASLTGARHVAFHDISIQSPRLSPPELGFYQAVTWLYVFYYESGRISIPFLIDRLPIYGLSGQGRHSRHYEDVGQLRTYLQHNLNLQSDRGSQLQHQCEQWFANSCGSTIPRPDNEWIDCLKCVLESSDDLIVSAIDCLRSIERDESRGIIVDQWLSRLRHYHPKHVFTELVAAVLHDMGQESLDPSRITDRYYEKWSKSLRMMSASYVFDEDARRLIERTLLSEAELPLPILGQGHYERIQFTTGKGGRHPLKESYDVIP